MLITLLQYLTPDTLQVDEIIRDVSAIDNSIFLIICFSSFIFFFPFLFFSIFNFFHLLLQFSQYLQYLEPQFLLNFYLFRCLKKVEHHFKIWIKQNVLLLRNILQPRHKLYFGGKFSWECYSSHSDYHVYRNSHNFIK